MNITFAKPANVASGAVAALVLSNNKLSASASELDTRTGGAVVRAIKASRFKGNKGQVLSILAPQGTKLTRILLIGLGKPAEIDELGLQAAGGKAYKALATTGQTALSVCVDAVEGCKIAAPDMAAQMAYGSKLSSYRFDKYRTKMKDEEKPSLKSIKYQSELFAKAKAAYTPLNKIADGVFMTRDLVSEPANILYPESLANRTKELTKLGIKVEILGETRMKKLGMGALLGVGQGSIRESKMVVMQWNGAPKKGKGKADAPIAFVGKGVTFDTGGISIKPSGGMEDMKWDMGGSGVVVGLMKALAGRKAKVNVVGIIGCVENMPGGNAQRPGDIVTSMSGQTIEVLNTDAEGRLVLADALHYCNTRFKPKFMVNLATLTGAIIISLGTEYAGLFSNNDTLSERLSEAGKQSDEKLWRMPLNDSYDKAINSAAADMRNIGDGRGAGSSTAAQFLQRFVDKTPWAHLDIAGVTWSKKDGATVPKGGTGFGVRLLDRLVANHYEKK